MTPSSYLRKLAFFGGITLATASGTTAQAQTTNDPIPPNSVGTVCTPAGVPQHWLNNKPQAEQERIGKLCAGYYWGLWQCAPYRENYRGIINSFPKIDARDLDPAFTGDTKTYTNFVQQRAGAFNEAGLSITQIGARMASWNDMVRKKLEEFGRTDRVATIADITALTRTDPFRLACPGPTPGGPR